MEYEEKGTGAAGTPRKDGEEAAATPRRAMTVSEAGVFPVR